MSLKRQQVLEYINSNPKTMQLATIHKGRPRVITVWFVCDEELNFYWFSLPTRRHSQDIELNNDVSCAIVIRPDDPTIGIQIQGKAEVVEDHEEAKAILNKYIDKYNKGNNFYSNLVSGVNKHQLYKLVASEITVFDEEKYKGETRSLEL